MSRKEGKVSETLIEVTHKHWDESVIVAVSNEWQWVDELDIALRVVGVKEIAEASNASPR